MIKRKLIVLLVFILNFGLLNAQEKDTIHLNNPSVNGLLMPDLPSLQTENPQESLFNESSFLADTLNKFPSFNFSGILGKAYYPVNIFGKINPSLPGLADIRNYGGNLGRFSLSKKLKMDYGAFVSVQSGYLFSSQQLVFGGNVVYQYALTSKLYLLAWGQYVTPNTSSDETFNLPQITPRTNIGGGLQYNANDKSKIRVGVEYQYDQSDKTWKAESGGKVQVNF